MWLAHLRVESSGGKTILREWNWDCIKWSGEG